MNNQKCNGYTNYATWAVSLWLDNSQCSQEYWHKVARRIYDKEAREQEHFSKMEDATYILADKLKNDHEEARCQIMEDNMLTTSLWADLLNAALSEVNWEEIAKNLLEDVQVKA